MTRVRASLAGASRWELWFYGFFKRLIRIGAAGWFRLSVDGAAHIPARSGPFVIAPVHRSNLDTPLVGSIFPYRVRFMGKDTLWSRPAGNWFLSALGGFPVTRGSADREALQKSFGVLEAGEPLVLFPEGERKSGPLVQPLYDGAVYVAAKYRVPILPVGVGGSERAMPKGSRFIRPRKVHIVIGEPITTADRLPGTGRVPRAALSALSAELHDRLQELFDLAQIRAGA